MLGYVSFAQDLIGGSETNMVRHRAVGWGRVSGAA